MFKKKLLLSIGTIAAIGAPIGAVVACGSDNNITEKSTIKNDVTNGKTLVSMMTDPENPRWVNASNQMKKNALGNGFDVRAGQAKKQADQNSWLRTNGIDKNDTAVLVVGPTDETVSEIVTAAGQKKIPFIAYDKMIEAKGSTYKWFVSFDSEKVGSLQGKALILGMYGIDFNADKAEGEAAIAADTPEKFVTELKTLISKKGEDGKEDAKWKAKKIFLAVAGDPADDNASLFFKGAATYIKAVMDAKILNIQFTTTDDTAFVADGKGSETFDKIAQANWDYNKGQTYLEGQIGENVKSIDGILSPNDGMAQAAVAAITAKKGDAKNVYITGQDANKPGLKSIKNNTGQNMSIAKPDKITTKVVSKLAELLIDGDTSNDNEAGLKAALANYDDVKTDNWIVKTAAKNSDVTQVLLNPVIITSDNIDDYYNGN